MVPMAGPAEIVVRARAPADDAWVVSSLEREWGSVLAARRGELVDASALPGYVAEVDGQPVGLATIAVRGAEAEVVSIATSLPRRGVGRALLVRCVEHARSVGCRRLWLTTTNNNIAAIAFYQQVGLDLCAFHRGAVARSRVLKPVIPLRDAAGLPIDHELEFEIRLDR
jgi:ribosomal protein S18 acetylase RimI-like enzyme